MLDTLRVQSFIEEMWSFAGEEKSLVVQGLEDFIRIPNLSPAFDEYWAENGHLDAAAEALAASVEKLKEFWAGRGIRTNDISVEIIGGRKAPLAGEDGKRRTPLLLVEVPAYAGYSGADTVLLYGHLDKQPEMLPWSAGLMPRVPLIRDGKLYGRGCADDGYALFSALSALAALRGQNAPHARSVILIEAREESDCVDIEYYLQSLAGHLGDVSFVTCLDSGAGNYERLWLTSSLRGIVSGLLKVTVLSGGVHSGLASGIVPSPFRILRALLSRIEDQTSGVVRLKALHTLIPAAVAGEAKDAANALGDNVFRHFPFIDEKVRPVTADRARLLLNRTWRPQLSVTGVSGLPEAARAGSVTLPYVEAKISIRTPPTLDGHKAGAAVKKLFEEKPPYNAHVVFTADEPRSGWAAPQRAQWLERAAQEASVAFFGKKSLSLGEGGTIDLISMLSGAYPAAELFITGVLGPGANAHGPDESLDLDMARKVTMCAAHVLAAHAARKA
ncbi:MAG: M20/M25/M40 family metallo-hydrolase [Desulfovibrio sp.]|nr:M20/M25/M40 family metallo-hydrolase [Desulfovibrio sp.]